MTWDILKLRNSLYQKTVVQRQAAGWEKIFALYIHDE